MKIVHYNNVDFNIDSNGNITRSATWHVMADENVITDWTSLRESVEEWAGDIGDDWRLPGDDSQSYTTDENYVVTSIGFKSLSRYMYEVSYNGEKKYLTSEMIGGINISINSNAETEKNTKWRVYTDSLDDFLPAPGDVMSWAGELYLCSSISATANATGIYEVTLNAKDMSVLMIGNPSYQKTRMREQVKNATWRIDPDSYDDFISSNDIDSDASSWAGDGYYVTSVNASPNGVLGYNVQLEAKHISVRLISVKKDIQFKGYNTSGGAKKDEVYTGRWQVHADSIEEFYDMIGESASDWAEEDFTVTEIHPNYISDIEYEVTLTAKNLSSSTSIKISSHDYRDDIESGTPVYTGDTYEFLITAENAGWTTDTDGSNKKIENWDASSNCPFANQSSALDENLINETIICATVTKTRYHKGDPAKYVDTLNDWQHDSSQVLNGKLGNYSGSFRKVGISSRRVLNRAGETYTRIDEVYQECPGTFTWNSTWVNKGR